MTRLYSLQNLRAAAALLVVAFHTQVTFGVTGPASAGYRGVDLFFVLSGFIILTVHAPDLGRPDRLWRYARRRLTRVYPAALTMTGFALAMYAVGFGGADKAAKLAPDAILASALLLPQLGTPLVNVTWTLTYEMAFYTLFAVAILHRASGVALVVAWQAAVVAVAVSGIDPVAWFGVGGRFLLPICLDFGVGMAVAWWARSTPATAGRLWWWALGLGVAAFADGMATGSHAGSGALCVLGSGAVVLALVKLEQAALVRPSRLGGRLGDASYAIYLTHFSALTVLAAVFARLRVAPTPLVCGGAAVVAVAVGLAFDALIDRPIQRVLAPVGKRAPARRGWLSGSPASPP